MMRFAFFGTSHRAVLVLECLERASLFPSLVITPPPRPSGRGLALTHSKAEDWARERNIPLSYDADSFSKNAWDLAIVVDYGLLIPKKLLDIPTHGFLNVHPSLLPRLRGPSPIRSAILFEEKTGVSIMRLDEKTDHGPVRLLKSGFCVGVENCLLKCYRAISKEK
jgi:methionyl-tRNA formyltransferase